MKKEKVLNRIEKDILRVLLKEKRPLTINEISKESGVSWVTVKDYLPKMIKKGVIDGVKEE